MRRVGRVGMVVGVVTSERNQLITSTLRIDITYGFKGNIKPLKIFEFNALIHRSSIIELRRVEI